MVVLWLRFYVVFDHAQRGSLVAARCFLILILPSGYLGCGSFSDIEVYRMWWRVSGARDVWVGRLHACASNC